MKQNLSALVIACLLGTTLANNEANVLDESSIGAMISSTDTDAMEEVFLRSEETHKNAMTSIMKSMSVAKAVDVLQKNNLTSPGLMQVTNMVLGGKSNLRKQPKGYAGLDGARKLLNDMIFESMSKYDAEIAKCTEYYSVQCANLEKARGEIAAANYMGANARSLILVSQATINRCEVDIPTKQLSLAEHLRQCDNELSTLRTRLTIVMGDISVMTTILKLTDCSANKALLQMRRCTNPCTKKSLIEFERTDLQDHVNKLQSKLSHKLFQDTLGDLFDGIQSLESSETEFLQTDEPIVVGNKTKFNNPPVPKMPMPGNPCNDANAGAPVPPGGKRNAGCKLSPSNCYKLQERFLLIQSGIQDERDDLQEHIAMLEQYREDTKKTIEAQISGCQNELDDAQTELAKAMKNEATAGEEARESSAYNWQLNEDLVKQVKTCTTNYGTLESEMCALKKIRGELYKMRGDGHDGFFTDCSVSPWGPEECTKVCGGGEQNITRTVQAQPDGGTKCLPLKAMRSCSNKPCPVDCQLHAWSGWSKCSSDCGGGVTQRLREVKRAMSYGGKACGATSETKACNNQACEVDCVLSRWTKWSSCSKDCDGGSKRRQKYVFKPAIGAGKCPDKWEKDRLQYKPCNMHRCQLPAGDDTLHCYDKPIDVVLLLDGSGSMGRKGWTNEILATQKLIDSFMDPRLKEGFQAQLAVILYSGPRTWSQYFRCFSGKTPKAERPKICGVQTITHFTNDLHKVKNLVTGLKWPKGGTLTSLALRIAGAELSLGRKNSHSSVIALTDGRPMSYRATTLAARSLRKAARLLWVPITQRAPLKFIKKWATRRWQENIVHVNSFTDLDVTKNDIVTHIIADICPEANPEMMSFGRLE